MATSKKPVVIRALRTTQGEGLDVYSFFIKGSDIVRVADISRVERDEEDELKGFQRPEIKNHVKGIVDYLNQGQVLFPNAIILAMSPDVKFTASRGPKQSGDDGISVSGTLSIPIYEEGKRVAWIVDGQQRSLALAQASHKSIPVPVVAFVSDSLEVQREQFILVNKAKPLPTRLINELLPETRGILLPRELSVRKVPSEICNLLNRDSNSPFYQLIKRTSDKSKSPAVITDTAVISMIKNSMSNPLGALAPFKASGREGNDIEGMYSVLLTYWNAVRDVFPDAWGKDPRHSRLMHSAGIIAMGVLMDRIFAKLPVGADDLKTVKRELERVSPHCHWTKGQWESLGLAWNEIQSTTRDIKKLQDALVRAYAGSAKR
ncbi:MAG: DGQHR domain-containing protein [Burkholderiales bacterium]|nr:MAG: DGQHR domain-containing protein [Burkholderiales bacterium]